MLLMPWLLPTCYRLCKILVFNDKWFQQPVPSQKWWIHANVICLYKIDSALQGITSFISGQLLRVQWSTKVHHHYNDVIMSAMGSQITSLTIVYSTVYSGPDERKHQSSMSLAFLRGIHWWLVNSSHKGPVKRKVVPFDDVIMITLVYFGSWDISCTNKLDM